MIKSRIPAGNGTASLFLSCRRSKHQRNPKFQAPNRSPRFELGAWSFSGVWSLVFGVWDLVLLWSLEFGIWSLLTGLSASQKLGYAPLLPRFQFSVARRLRRN